MRRPESILSIRGITILEYSVLTLVLLLALLASQNHLRRAISDRWRTVADVFGSGRQYESSGPKATQVIPYGP